MPESLFSVCRYLAVRYVSVGRSSHLVSFMSALAVFGLSLSVAILVLVLSVMNGFDREMRHTILGIVPHITLYTDENLLQSDWDAVIDQLASHSDLASISPVVQAMGAVSGGGGNRGVIINGIDRETDRAYAALDDYFVSGSLPDLYENRWGVAIGESREGVDMHAFAGVTVLLGRVVGPDHFLTERDFLERGPSIVKEDVAVGQ